MVRAPAAPSANPVDAEAAKGRAGAGRYLAKYLAKSMADEARGLGEHRFACGQKTPAPPVTRCGWRGRVELAEWGRTVYAVPQGAVIRTAEDTNGTCLWWAGWQEGRTPPLPRVSVRRTLLDTG